MIGSFCFFIYITSSNLNLPPVDHKGDLLAQLRTRQHWRDNVTMFSGHYRDGYRIAFCLYFLWLLHLDSETITCFRFYQVPGALLSCRVVVVAKLNNCRVPSSAYLSRELRTRLTEVKGPRRRAGGLGKQSDAYTK